MKKHCKLQNYLKNLFGPWTHFNLNYLNRFEIGFYGSIYNQTTSN